jgi:hypothetical protein
MNTQPAQRAVTTMASPMIIGKDEPFITKLAFVVVALLIGILCFTALMALASAVMPRTAARCRSAVERWPIQAFAVGLLTYAIGGGLTWYLLSRGYIPRLLKVQIVLPMLIPGLALATLLLLVTVVGAMGTVRLLGERLTQVPDNVTPAPPVRQIVTGTLTCVLASLFPVIGWGLVLPALLCVSSGALVLGWIRGRQLS